MVTAIFSVCSEHAGLVLHARRALLAFVAAYIAFFAISSGAVVWVYVSEIFPTSVRMKG
jgi:hypothetical protein